MSLIPRSFIDDLLARIDIVEVISSRVQLRKIGNNFKALCPFHTEKSPSFTVNSNKQFYYCFGCGAHGNAISFLMDFDRMDFIDAVESLAALLSLEVPREVNANQQQNQQSQQELYKLLIGVNRLYQQELRESQQSTNYLKSRG
ncbi:MAG: DNA primase, partial [Gammaproteobacteria bacterium]|nr:DNA primase [Gammaproteobacteria bacterium]